MILTGPKGGRYVLKPDGRKRYCKKKKARVNKRECTKDQEKKVVQYPPGPKQGRYYLSRNGKKVYCRLREDLGADVIAEEEEDIEASIREYESKQKEIAKKKKKEDEIYVEELEEQMDLPEGSPRIEPMSHQPIALYRRYPIIQMQKLKSDPRRKVCLPRGFETNTAKLIASGSYGQVFAACDAKTGNCDFVVKQSDYDEDSNERDLYFLMWLGQQSLQKLPIVPKLVSASFCYSSEPERKRGPKKRMEERESQPSTARLEPFRKNNQRSKPVFFSLVMEKWDGDVLKNIPNFKGRKAIPEYYLLQMFDLAIRLQELGIVHGDLKPDQFLYSQDKPYLVLTDFGLSGHLSREKAIENGPVSDLAPVPYYYEPILGWDVTSCFKQNSRMPIDENHPFRKSGVLPYLNVLQLEHYFYTYSPDILLANDQTIRKFRGVSNEIVPRNIRNIYQTICSLEGPKSGYVVTPSKIEANRKKIFDQL